MTCILFHLHPGESPEALRDHLKFFAQRSSRQVDQTIFLDDKAARSVWAAYPVADDRRVASMLHALSAQRKGRALLVSSRGGRVTAHAYAPDGYARAEWPLRGESGADDWRQLARVLERPAFVPDEHALLGDEVLAAWCDAQGWPLSAMLEGAAGAHAAGLPAVGRTITYGEGQVRLDALWPRGTVHTMYASEARFALDVESAGALDVVGVHAGDTPLGRLLFDDGQSERVHVADAECYAVAATLAPRSALAQALDRRAGDASFGVELRSDAPVRAKLERVVFGAGRVDIYLSTALEPVHAPSEGDDAA